MTTILIIILGLLAIFGLPIFAVLGGITLLLFNSIGQEIGLTMGDAYRIATMPGLVALPLFVFTGYLLYETRISSRILRFLTAITGWMPGGVAIASMIAMVIFTAFTGVSIVTIVVFGGILYPLLTKLGYSKNLSMGFITSVPPMGVLIPPCIAVVLYGLIAQVSIRGLYIASFLPMLLSFTLFAIYIGIYSIKNNIQRQRFSFKEFWNSFCDFIWEAPLVILILVGIFWGFFTVNEAAAVTVVYFLIVELFILKEVKTKQLPRIMEESMIMLGAIFLILGVALSFANFLVYQEIPMQMLGWVRSSITSKISFLIILNLFLFGVGMLIDMFTAIVVVVPLILPISNYFGVNPYHLGVIFLMNLEIGHLTPPVGINLFVAAMRFNQPIIKVFRSVIVFLFILIVSLVIITYWSALSTFLVDLFNVKGQIIL